MNLRIFSLIISFLVGVTLLSYFLTQPSQQKQHEHVVVVSFTILEDFAKHLLQDIPAIHLHTIIDCNQDPHTFHPHPKLCVLLKQADMVIINGLDFEPWFPSCREQISGRVVVASNGIIPLRQIQNPALFDPHAWHSVKNAKIYVCNMRNALKEVYPQFAATIERNHQRFQKELDDLITWIFQQFEQTKERTIITTHDAFWYYGKAYGIQFISPQGISTEEEISAATMAQIVRTIKERHVKALFLENLSNSAAIKQLAQETHTQIGGILYADSLSNSKGPCPTYSSMIRHNTTAIQKALGSPIK